jgi:hypothetical protein
MAVQNRRKFNLFIQKNLRSRENSSTLLYPLNLSIQVETSLATRKRKKKIDFIAFKKINKNQS